MMKPDGGLAFPVVFFDGETRIRIGDVRIDATVEYKPFQILLSQMIGISPNQITTYLVDRKTNPISPLSDSCRRIPITGRVNFALICLQKDCYFLVVLKRSRKPRNRRERPTNAFEFGDFVTDEFYSRPMPLSFRPDEPYPFYDHISENDLEYLNDQLHSQSFQKENYQLAKEDRDSTPIVDDMQRTANNKMEKVHCEECAKEEKSGGTASFHPCVNDTVINRWFRTRAGPIKRPNVKIH